MLDLKEERRYSRLRKLAQELHIPMPEAFITLEVFDKDGRLLQRHHQRSHSWARNAYNMVFSNLAGKDATDATWEAGKLSLKDTAAAIWNGAGIISISARSEYSVESEWRGYNADAGVVTNGILVGSGTNAESFEDYVLQTPIANGTGAGELSYVASEGMAMSYADTTLTNTIIRYFNNNTVGETSVDVNEVALVGAVGAPDEAAHKFAVMARDKLASTVTVPSTGQLKVTYTVQLAYPS